MTGRPRKHSVEDLVDCLRQHSFTTGEFQQRAAETLDISRAAFYRLLKAGQEQYRFRQHGVDGTWRLIPEKTEPVPPVVSESQNKSLEAAPDDLPPSW